MQKYQNVVVDNQGNVIYGATITVVNRRTGENADIYSDDAVTQKTNPFVATALNGSFEFYALNGRYDVNIEKTGFNPNSIEDIILFDIAETPLGFGGNLTVPGNIYIKEGQGIITTNDGQIEGIQRSAIRFRNDNSTDILVGESVKLTLDPSGDLLPQGGVDGRDLAADGAKLDGIESGATADQTAGEIKTLYESNLDTNAFTDAEETKLAGIEDGATADQTAGEIKTLYESNLDTNAYTDTEKSKLAGIESGATADQTGAEIKTLYEAEADTNAYTDSEKSKLAGIEAAAKDDQVWGEIGGTLTSQTDLQGALDAKLANVSGDTTPQLGGNLDVNGQSIVSVSAGDINITPDTTGKTKATNLEAPIPTNNQTGTAYTLVLADASKHVTMNNASANTLTIPANSSVAFPVGTQVLISQLGAGATTVAITTDTLNVNADFTLTLAGQYSQALITKITSTSWLICGDLGLA